MNASEYRNLFSLEGRVALVIGGGSGIGRASAEALAAFGARCVVADLNLEGAEETAKLIGRSAEARHVDVTSTRSVDALVREVGRIDVLLTTPARNLRKRAGRLQRRGVRPRHRPEPQGSFRVARAVARPMMQQRSGSIILMSSMRAYSVEPGQSIYAATKAGIGQMTKGLATELAPHGVRVNALAPGIVETPLTQPITGNPQWKEAYSSRTALGRWARAEEMAGPVVFLASDASSYLTATVIVADAGWTEIDGRYTPPV